MRTPINNSAAGKDGIGDRGFTLIEIAVVIFILSLMAAFVVPSLLDESEFYLKSSARRLKGAIAYLYSQSAGRKMYLRLNFDLKEQRYWVTTVNDKGEAVEVNLELARPVTLPHNIKFVDISSLHDGKKTEGETFIQFFPRGYVEQCIIHIGDDKGRVYSLIIVPLTGEAKIVDHYVDMQQG